MSAGEDNRIYAIEEKEKLGKKKMAEINTQSKRIKIGGSKRRKIENKDD